MKPANLEKKQIDLIRESLCVYRKCMDCGELYREKKLCFTAIEEFVDDRGKSCLFRLKEMCHELFRTAEEATYKEKLYDITVGYIFHEAMKLRENLYQLEYYMPRSDVAPHELTSQERKIVHEIESLVKKAEKRMTEGLKEVKVLLGELVGQMKGLIKLYKDNYLLPRFIYENEKSLVRVYGKKELHNLLCEMYNDGRTLLMFKAAESYLASEYFEIARTLFHRVRSIDRGNSGALFLYLYSSAHFFYYRNMFSRALRCAAEAQALGLEDGVVERYGPSLSKLISDLSKEVKRGRKT
jgi:hypothetical protein